MPRKSPRDSWKKAKKSGLWVRSLGSRGTRIRLFESANGMFYSDEWSSGRKIRTSLRTTDKNEADRLGNQRLAELLQGEEVVNSGVLTLKHLWERYSKESPDFLDNTERTRKEDKAHVRVLMDFFSEGADVRKLTEHDVKAFTSNRLAGGIALNSGEKSQPVGARTPEMEIRILRTMLRWATTYRVRGGQRLLAQDPLAGVRGKGESNPKRPRATWERFNSLRSAMRELSEQTANQRWVRIEFALVLAEATGRRIGSIRQLAWQDFDLEGATIRWRAETDKKRKEWLVPIPTPLLEEVKRFRLLLGGGFGGLVFPRPTDPTKPLGREIFQHALADATAHAKLPVLGGWHSLRRKWVSERKHHPQADVLAAGGWSPKSGAVLVECYTVPDRETMLAVMSESLKVTERATGT